MNNSIIEVLKNIGISITANVIFDVGKNIVRLLPHQEKNLSKWLEEWNPSEKDLESIKMNPNLQRIVSIIFEKVENEIYQQKLSSWGKITDCVIRDKAFLNAEMVEAELRLYFIKLFSDMPISVIDYLLNIRQKGSLPMVGSYPEENPEKDLAYFNDNYCVCLSLTEVFSGGVKLTRRGEQFLNFIGDEYQKR